MSIRASSVAFLLAFVLGLSGCNDRPQVLPQGTPEQQAEDVRARSLMVLTMLAAGQGGELDERELVILPLRWRRNAQLQEEIAALGEHLKGREDFSLGEVRVRGRWALVDGVYAGGERVGPAEVPWFMVYFAGEWRWVPSSILKDPAVTGMMDRSFDRLYAEWQAARPQ